jgi:hypothetical protein
MIKQGGGKLGSEECTLQVDLKYLLVLLFRCFKYGCICTCTRRVIYPGGAP